MEKVQNLGSEQLQSKVISFLRFPLIVGVVLIHTQIGTINGVGGNLSAPHPFDGAFPFYETTLYLFTQILARISVPLFFMFSGFLFFYKTEEFTLATYVTKLKKRVHTLLIPYLFWNVLFIIFYNLSGKMFPGATESFIGEGYTIKDWLMTLWNSNNTDCPISYQFWFIRDLMVVVLFTPMIYWFTKKLDFLFPLTLCLLWMMKWWFDITGFKIDAFFFFSLGAYFSVTKKNFVELVKPYTIYLGLLYLMIVVMILYCRDYEWIGYTKRIGILVGLSFVISLSAVYIEKGKWRVNAFLSESSFFIYAYHIIALPIIRRILSIIVSANTDSKAVLFYFLWAGIAVAIGLLVYRYMRRWIPRITAFITGGR